MKKFKKKLDSRLKAKIQLQELSNDGKNHQFLDKVQNYINTLRHTKIRSRDHGTKYFYIFILLKNVKNVIKCKIYGEGKGKSSK